MVRVRGHGEQGSNSAFGHDRTLYSLAPRSCDCLVRLAQDQASQQSDTDGEAHTSLHCLLTSVVSVTTSASGGSSCSLEPFFFVTFGDIIFDFQDFDHEEPKCVFLPCVRLWKESLCSLVGNFCIGPE